MHRIQKIHFLFLFFLFPFLSFAQESSSVYKSKFIVLPYVLQVAGVGNIYGPAVVWKNPGDQAFDIGAVSSFGEVKSSFGFYTQYWDDKKSRFNITSGNIDEFNMDMSYTRGLTKDQPVRLKGKGSVFSAVLTLGTPNEGFVANFGLAQTRIEFLSYKDDSGDDLELPGLHLTALPTTNIFFSSSYSYWAQNEKFHQGIQISGKYLQTQNTTQLSDTVTVDLSLTYYQAVSKTTRLVFNALSSEASVTKEKTPSQDKVKEILNIDCESLSNTQQEKCNTFRENISKYISENNQNGTAKPLGGSQRLRAFRELRFRGANSRFVGAELQSDFDNFTLAAFYEVAYVSDKVGNIYDENRSSHGYAIRYNISPELLLRMEYGISGSEQQFHLTIGRPW